MAAEVSVSPVVIRAGGGDKELSYLLDNAKIDLVADLAAHRSLPPIVVLDLRRYAGSERAVGQALTFNRFCEVSGTKLAVVVGPSRVRDTIAEFGFERAFRVCGAAELREQYGIDVDAPNTNPPEPPVTITEEECRKMREDGFTFADGIREIKPLLRRG